MNDIRSPEQIEREIDELRAQIGDTLDAVQQKLSPGQLLDHALSYAKDGGALAANVGRGMRENPVPAALFGISLAWLWYAGSRGAPQTVGSCEPPDGADPAETAARRLEATRHDLAAAGQKATRFARQNPLTTAAAALAAGAVIGALLPRRNR